MNYKVKLISYQEANIFWGESSDKVVKIIPSFGYVFDVIESPLGKLGEGFCSMGDVLASLPRPVLLKVELDKGIPILIGN